MAIFSRTWPRKSPGRWALRDRRISATAAPCSRPSTAPRRANQNLANPSGLLLGGVLMLVHINQPDTAARVQNAWLRTIEDGVHTYDIFTEGSSKQKVGTKEFAQAVVARLGQKPNTLKPVGYAAAPPAGAAREAAVRPDPKVDLIGV